MADDKTNEPDVSAEESTIQAIAQLLQQKQGLGVDMPAFIEMLEAEKTESARRVQLAKTVMHVVQGTVRFLAAHMAGGE